MYVAWVVCVQLCIGLTLSCRDRMNSIALPVLALLACSCGALQPTHERDDVAVRAWSAADVAEWVRSIGFPEYADVFEESAIDGRALLRMTLHTLRSELLIPSVEHSLAIEMELGELKHRRKLLSPMEATSHRVAHPTADEWSTAEVRDYLEALGFGRYAPRFERVDGQELLAMSSDELQERINVQPDVLEENGAVLQLLSAQLAILRERGGGGSATAGVKGEL